MATARGFSIPHTFTDGVGSKLTVQGGALTLKTDGTYALNYKGKLNSITFDLTDDGTYTLSGSTATFTPDDGDPAYTGKMQGGTVLVGFRIAGAPFDLGFKGNQPRSSMPACLRKSPGEYSSHPSSDAGNDAPSVAS